jgi:hypothetical protein
MWVNTGYRITTTEGVYWLYFDYVFIDNADPDAEGIYCLSFYDEKTINIIVAEASSDRNPNVGIVPYHAGIYHPGWDGKYPGYQDPAAGRME